MTLLTEPTRIVLAKGWDLSGFDADAAAYIQRVEWADTTPLEAATRTAINSFVVGCKADGIWTAIKASCILAGARTLSGALMPLTGTAPTNVGGLFVSGDYNRKTGLVGDGSTKYLNSNYLANNLSAGNASQSVYYSVPHAGGLSVQIGVRVTSPLNASQVANTSIDLWVVQTQNNNPEVFYGNRNVATFVGGSRLGTTQELRRMNGASYIDLSTAINPPALNYFVFASNTNGSAANFTNARLAFYSIGESLNLALLDARVTDLINAFAAAIP